MTARILFVDDDPGLSEVVELLLTGEGYAVVCASSVKAGLERLRRTRIDLVITDLRLPDGTGLDAIAAIRRLRPELLIIMITSFSLLRDIRRVFEYHGAEHKVVYTWEADEELTVANARSKQRQHPRCVYTPDYISASGNFWTARLACP